MKLGVLFLNLGGPRDLTEVEPFLYRLFSDPDTLPVPFSKWLQKPVAKLISKGRLRKSQSYYRAIGGGSPLFEITSQQANGVWKELSKSFLDVSVYIAMRYGFPTTEEAWRTILNDGLTDLVIFPLYPHYSMATTGSSFHDLKRAQASFPGLTGESPRLRWIKEWYSHPLYIEAFSDLIQHSINHLPTHTKTNFDLVFSAHSLPLKFIKRGDPYEHQIKETVRLILEKLQGVKTWHLSYQSRVGPMGWLGPSTSALLKRLAQEKKGVLMVPISFVSDHVETLYEMDILYRKQALKLGISYFNRVPSLNTTPKFILAMSRVIQSCLS